VSLFGAYVIGALSLGIFMATLAMLAVSAASADAEAYASHDDVRTLWAEREALRLLRCRYAQGQVSLDEYKRLCYELETGRDAKGET